MASDALIPHLLAFPFVILIWIVCVFWSLKQFYCTVAAPSAPKKNKSQKLLHGITTTYLTCFTISTLSAFILITLALSYVTLFYNTNIGYYIMMLFIIITGFIGYMSFYTFLYLRIYLIFKGTTYAIKATTILKYIIFSVFVGTLLCIYAISYYFFKDLLPTYRYLVMSIAVIAFLMNFFIASSIIYMLSSRLIKLAIGIDDRRFANAVVIDKQLTNAQQDLIHVVTKQCLLGCIAIIMFDVIIPINFSLYASKVYPHNIFTYLLMIHIAFVCHAIEMICVLLVFAFNQKYYACLCSGCHNRCNYFCVKYTKNKIFDNSSFDLDIKPVEPVTSHSVDSPNDTKNIKTNPSDLNAKMITLNIADEEIKIDKPVDQFDPDNTEMQFVDDDDKKTVINNNNKKAPPSLKSVQSVKKTAVELNSLVLIMEQSVKDVKPSLNRTYTAPGINKENKNNNVKPALQSRVTWKD